MLVQWTSKVCPFHVSKIFLVHVHFNTEITANAFERYIKFKKPVISDMDMNDISPTFFVMDYFS